MVTAVVVMLKAMVVWVVKVVEVVWVVETVVVVEMVEEDTELSLSKHSADHFQNSNRLYVHKPPSKLSPKKTCRSCPSQSSCPTQRCPR